uniref:Peptidyl-prolyl cis-trans isomerase FKBP16-4, chloroplastic n=1 Tax=Tanacetum cinerariifolium TaxID=118510 RepID=A0A699HCK2_TANCI|nr:peptidyl-prolyl cis-trans isomerase FKBP16-4, chloroplastic [Tanacetum cinerariifolium]
MAEGSSFKIVMVSIDSNEFKDLLQTLLADNDQKLLEAQAEIKELIVMCNISLTTVYSKLEKEFKLTDSLLQRKEKLTIEGPNEDETELARVASKLRSTLLALAAHATDSTNSLERIRPVDSCKPEKFPLPIIFLLGNTCADVESGSSDFWVMVVALKVLLEQLQVMSNKTVPAFPVKAINTIGAGDSFIGALLTKIVDDQSMLQLKGEKVLESEYTTLSNGLKYYDLKVGKGAEAVKGSRVADEAKLKDIMRYLCACEEITTTKKGATPSLPSVMEVQTFMDAQHS